MGGTPGSRKWRPRKTRRIRRRRPKPTKRLGRGRRRRGLWIGGSFRTPRKSRGRTPEHLAAKGESIGRRPRSRKTPATEGWPGRSLARARDRSRMRTGWSPRPLRRRRESPQRPRRRSGRNRRTRRRRKRSGHRPPQKRKGRRSRGGGFWGVVACRDNSETRTRRKIRARIRETELGMP